MTTTPPSLPAIALPAVGTGFALDKVRFLSWGDCHPADLARKGGGWHPLDKEHFQGQRNALARLCFLRHERGALMLTGSALAFASYLDGRPAVANILPPEGMAGQRIADVLRLMLHRGAPATAATHFLDGTRQGDWKWHHRNAVGQDGDPPPRRKRLSRWFALNRAEVCADAFTPDCLQVIEAAKFIQGRGRKTDFGTTAYLSQPVKLYAKSIQLWGAKGVSIPPNLLRFEISADAGDAGRWGRLLHVLPEHRGPDAVPFYVGAREHPARRWVDPAALRAFMVEELRRLEGDRVSTDGLTARQRRIFGRLRGEPFALVCPWWKRRRPDIDRKGNDRRAVMRALYWDRLVGLGMGSLADALPVLGSP
jgi:hypothetical protein